MYCLSVVEPPSEIECQIENMNDEQRRTFLHTFCAVTTDTVNKKLCARFVSLVI